jgi:hypothetical protein
MSSNGFKQGSGCMDVIFLVKTVVDNFVEHGSLVYSTTLHLTKAFDTVDLHELYQTLLVAGIYPTPLLTSFVVGIANYLLLCAGTIIFRGIFMHRCKKRFLRFLFFS